jgi:hypothetical protein
LGSADCYLAAYLASVSQVNDFRKITELASNGNNTDDTPSWVAWANALSGYGRETGPTHRLKLAYIKKSSMEA